MADSVIRGKERTGQEIADKRRLGKPTSGCWEYQLFVDVASDVEQAG